MRSVEKCWGAGSGGDGFPAHRPWEPGVPAPEGILQDVFQHGHPDLDGPVGAAPALSAWVVSWPGAGQLTWLTLDSTTAVEMRWPEAVVRRVVDQADVVCR